MSINFQSLWQLNQRCGNAALQLPRADFDERASIADLLLTKKSDSTLCGFLLGINAGKSVENFSYQWFQMRFDSFLYIDRLTVDLARRRCGVATALYAEASQWCREQGVEKIVCQVYDRPPNAAGHAFLKAMQFVDLESVMLPSREIVTMYQRSMAIATP